MLTTLSRLLALVTQSSGSVTAELLSMDMSDSILDPEFGLVDDVVLWPSELLIPVVGRVGCPGPVPTLVPNCAELELVLDCESLDKWFVVTLARFDLSNELSISFFHFL